MNVIRDIIVILFIGFIANINEKELKINEELKMKKYSGR